MYDCVELQETKNQEDVVIAVSLTLGGSHGEIIIEKGSSTVYHGFHPSDDQNKYISQMVRSFIEGVYGCSLCEFIKDFYNEK